LRNIRLSTAFDKVVKRFQRVAVLFQLTYGKSLTLAVRRVGRRLTGNIADLPAAPWAFWLDVTLHNSYLYEPLERKALAGDNAGWQDRALAAPVASVLTTGPVQRHLCDGRINGAPSWPNRIGAEN
jgi:hypothetical protein